MTIATARRRGCAAACQKQCWPGSAAVGQVLPSAREETAKGQCQEPVGCLLSRDASKVPRSTIPPRVDFWWQRALAHKPAGHRQSTRRARTTQYCVRSVCCAAGWTGQDLSCRQRKASSDLLASMRSGSTDTPWAWRDGVAERAASHSG